jgi:hypothetical protein
LKLSMQLSLFSPLLSLFPAGSWSRLSVCRCFVVAFVPVGSRPVPGLAGELRRAGVVLVASRPVSCPVYGSGVAFCLRCRSAVGSQLLALPRPCGGSRVVPLPW